MNKTAIQYLDYTYNPIAMRCTPVSVGCDNCWHLRMADRMKHNLTLGIERMGAYAGGPAVLLEDELTAPLRLKKPSVIGVQFMGDLFHEKVPMSFIEQVHNIMAITTRHTYLLLTKRPERVLEFYELWGHLPGHHLWLGVTAENQEQADKRIPILLSVPAEHRFLSIEPMLGAISMAKWAHPETDETANLCTVHGFDLVICGCESGPHRRETKVQWIRGLKNQCVAAGVPFFLKQGPGYIAGHPGVVNMPELDGRTWNELPWRKP